MPEIIVTKPFSYAHRGHQVEAYEPVGKPVSVSDDVAQLAVAEGWARKAHQAASRNKDAAGQRSTKGAAGEDTDDHAQA
jgi:hypothetical protein